jgi:alanyl-tRNA synthetase
MTEKLFYKDPYTREFEAEVVDIDGNKIILDRTAFYAESGGQPGDTGKIGDARVIDTVYEGGKITHVTESHNIKKGDHVSCEVDWDRRYTIMRLHSAAHIVYEFFVQKWGKRKVIGSNISESKARLDFEMDDSITESLSDISEMVNEFIQQNNDITTENDPEKQDFRWWSCGEFRMPCGGTHVKSSGEIGRVMLKRKNIGKGKERVEVTLAE